MDSDWLIMAIPAALLAALLVGYGICNANIRIFAISLEVEVLAICVGSSLTSKGQISLISALACLIMFLALVTNIILIASRHVELKRKQTEANNYQPEPLPEPEPV